MCGIAGFHGFEDKALLKRMCDVIRHRGPDDYGYFTGKNICMGNRRLSIIDLKTGRQPIHNEEETLWIVFNGEIYNYRELKETLESRGHRFYTDSDTETIVHAYEEYGDQCPSMLRGIFTFAIWDSVRERLFLARDRLGVKPLYYARIGGRFLFASEIKSILEYPVKRRVDLRALDSYLTFRYVPDSRTLFKGIRKLMPGRTLALEKGRCSVRKYWDIESRETERSLGFYEKRLLNLLRESVKMRLISDVPLGVYLSGGFDSSSVVALMKSMSDDPINTFSIGFGSDDPVNELKYARQVAEHFGTNHHEIISGRESMKILPKVVFHLDEPIVDATTIPTHILAEKSKKHFTVALTGEGGDEMFGGYVQYRSILLGEKIRRIIPGFFMKKMIGVTPVGVLDRFFEYPNSIGEKGKERLYDYVESLGDRGKSYHSFISLFTEHDKDMLYSDPMKYGKNRADHPGWLNRNFLGGRKGKFIDRIFMTELKTWLPNYILLRLDKMTMASGIEGRVPYLDHKLAEFSASIPSGLKIRGMDEKYIFRKTMGRFLPKMIRKRKKYPFFIPIHRWSGEIMEIAENLLSERVSERKDYFRQEYVRKAFENFERSELVYSRQIWGLLMFEIWHRIYIEREKPERISSRM